MAYSYSSTPVKRSRNTPDAPSMTALERINNFSISDRYCPDCGAKLRDALILEPHTCSSCGINLPAASEDNGIWNKCACCGCYNKCTNRRCGVCGLINALFDADKPRRMEEIARKKTRLEIMQEIKEEEQEMSQLYDNIMESQKTVEESQDGKNEGDIEARADNSTAVSMISAESDVESDGNGLSAENDDETRHENLL